MLNRKNTIAIVMGVLLSWVSFSSAQNMSAEEINTAVINEGETSFNYGFKVGTLGLGIDLSTPINDWMSLRLNANGLKYKSDDDSRYNSLISTDKTYDLQTVGLLIDYHLLQLRVTTGIYLNNNSIIDIAKPSGNSGVFLNGVNYTSSSITEVEQTITFNKISPYVGVGWGNNSRRDGWNISLDVGLMYHGDPQLELDITMNQDITIAKASDIRTNADEEIKIQEEDLSDFPFYPVVMVGLSYSF